MKILLSAAVLEPKVPARPVNVISPPFPFAYLLTSAIPTPRLLADEPAFCNSIPAEVSLLSSYLTVTLSLSALSFLAKIPVAVAAPFNETPPSTLIVVLVEVMSIEFSSFKL
ncbi:Uncharacterised protein [uncultured Leptotrichia sp.]|nr:Uncharacterised protein [uncultured Leptotrichia sp.]